MNKTASCIKLIQILYGIDDYVNTKTLAELLDTNPRNIREYFKELESVGYVIDSSKGLYGGYRILKSDMLPQVSLSKEETDCLNNLVNNLDEDYTDKALLISIIGKFLSSNNQVVTPLRMIDRFKSNMELDDIKYRYDILKEAIEEQYKIQISYLNFNDKESTHIIYPYKLFIYNGCYFVLAYNEIKDDYLFYKLDRISAISNLKNRFSKDNDFSLNDYLDEFGIKKNDEYYYVKIELTGLNKVIKNHTYGKNQKITIIDNNKAILEVELQNKSSILAFILAFGNNAKVLEPDWLIEDVKEMLFKALERYE